MTGLPPTWVVQLLGTESVAQAVLVISLVAAVGMALGSLKVRGLGLGTARALITIVPLLTVALVARIVWKLNCASLCGLLAGSMTDPPALAFATAIVGSEAPIVSYATVYPLVMLLRVLAAQVMVLTLAG